MSTSNLNKDQIIKKLRELNIPHDESQSKDALAKLLPPPPEKPKQQDRAQPSTRRVRENVVTKKGAMFRVGQEVTDEEVAAAELDDKYVE